MKDGTLPVLLKQPEVLVLGAGQAAARKVRALLANGVPCRLIAERVDDEILQLGVVAEQRSIHPDDLRHATIVVDATGSDQVLDLLLAEKKRRFFLLNCVSRPEVCDFYFSALFTRGQLKVAVSTGGGSPAIAQAVRDRIASVIPADLAELLQVKKDQRLRGIIEPDQSREQCRRLMATVYLIGCGPGAADLLTLRALRTLQQVDVALYDHLIPREILDLLPAHAERIPVGKQKGEHSLRQERINEMLYQQALRGLTVARLKGGDPYVFGRGFEELEYLTERGIRVEVISGLSSAIAGPASAGIPPTARSHATNMSIVSAHLADHRLNTDWLELLRIPFHTTIVLMGLSFAEQIAQQAIAVGINRELPVAIIVNATLPEQQVFVTDLEHLPLTARQARRPALLVFGEVVKLHFSQRPEDSTKTGPQP